MAFISSNSNSLVWPIRTPTAMPAGVNPGKILKCSPDRPRPAPCLQITMNITIIITTCIQWPNIIMLAEWPVAEAMEDKEATINTAVVSTMEAIKVMARPITVAHVISLEAAEADHHHRIVVDIMPEVVKGQ